MSWYLEFRSLFISLLELSTYQVWFPVQACPTHICTHTDLCFIHVKTCCKCPATIPKGVIYLIYTFLECLSLKVNESILVVWSHRCSSFSFTNLSHLRWKAQSCHLLFACGTGKERSGSHMKARFFLFIFRITWAEVLTPRVYFCFSLDLKNTKSCFTQEQLFSA